MAMNWGAFAGGAANSALGTYTQLNSERMKNLQTALFMEDMADKQKLKQASQDTFGKVGTDQYENINSILEAKGAEVSPEAMAIEKPVAPVQYTEQQAVTDFGKKLSAIDPVRGFEFKGKALQIKSAQRQADIDDKYDKLNEWFYGSMELGASTAEGKGMSGVPEAFNPKLKEAGVTLEYKEHSKGPGSIIAKDDKGKVVGTYTGMDQVMGAFKGALTKEYERRLVGLLGSADKALDYKLKRDKLDIDRDVAQSTIAKNRATGDYYTNSLNALGAPIGTDSQGAPIYQSKNGPVYGNRTAVDPKGEITPWNQQKGFTSQLSTQNVMIKGPDGKDTMMPVQIVSSMGRDNVPVNKVYDLGGKPIDDPSIIKQIGVKQAPKELSPTDTAALKTYNDTVAAWAKDGVATDDKLKNLARQLGITEIVRAPGKVPTAEILEKTTPSAWESIFGPPRAKPAPTTTPNAAPTSAIPTQKPLSVGEQNSRKLIEEVERELPNLTPERALEIKASRGYYTVLPKKLRDQVEAVIKSSEPPPRTLYSPR